MRNELQNTHGKGVEIHQPTCSVIDNNNPSPRTYISKASGTATVATGTPATITVTKTWRQIPAVGDEIFCYGFVNAGNNGIFTVTAATSTTVSFTNASAVNEALALTALGNISIYHAPVKVYQDVAFTSGIPNYVEIAAGASGTCTALNGVYSYLSVINTTDVDIEVLVAGGKLKCITGSTIGHEIRPFTSDVTCDASGASSGNVVINIS